MPDKIDEVDELETKIQEARIEKGDSVESIREWTDETEKGLQVCKRSVLEITKAVTELNRSKAAQEKQEEEELAAQLCDKKFEEEMKFEEMKLQQKLEYEKKAQEGLKKLEKDSSKLLTKLPKLVTTKFKGAQTDWLRFWSKFESEIDDADITKVTKFSNLKELLDPRVRNCIDGLPFTTEGYVRAKSILKFKYGKSSEVINAYVQNIIRLPVITSSHPNKILVFYETLVTNI